MPRASDAAFVSFYSFPMRLLVGRQNRESYLPLSGSGTASNIVADEKSDRSHNRRDDQQDEQKADGNHYFILRPSPRFGTPPFHCHLAGNFADSTEADRGLTCTRIGMAPDMQHNTQPQRSGYLSHLDGLRGLAALWVLLAHCMIWGGWYWRRMPDPKIAVDIFMVLSGYLMVHQWYAKREEDGNVTSTTALRFYVRRFFRIAPLYWAVVLFTFASSRWFMRGYETLKDVNHLQAVFDFGTMRFDWKSLLAHLTFLFGFSPGYASSILLPDWSIGLEMQFYLAFPLLLLGFRRVGAVVTLIACLGITRLWSRYGVRFPEPSFLLIKLNVFLVGMLAAEAVRMFELVPLRSAVLAALAVALAPANSYIVPDVAVLLVFLGVGAREAGWPAAQRVQDRLRWLLGNRLMQFMADTSYAVYLIHGFFISLIGGNVLLSMPRYAHLRAPMRVIILMAITIVGAYATGWFLHRFVERPGIALGRVLVRTIPTARKPNVVVEAAVL
jgi:peptidoglycan/LPS O-acetylase OafA/YrhL